MVTITVVDANQTTPAPTLEHVAKVAGVSRATVSRVINNVRNVDPQIAEVVRAAVEATGYVPNQAARSLVTRRTNSVALVVSEGEGRGVPADDAFVGRVFTDPYFGRVVSGLFSVLRPRGLNLVLMFVETDEMRQQLVGYLRQGHVDGVLLISSHPLDPLPRMLTEPGCPPCSRNGRTPRCGSATWTRRSGTAPGWPRTGWPSAAAARWRRSRGRWTCPRAATGSTASARRWQSTDIRRSRRVEGYFTQESGSAAMTRLLDEHPDLDGVFAANDLMALGAVTVLHERGRRIPEDVAVVGFDDHHAAMLCRPALTTVHLPVEEMAAEMARLLLDRLDRPELPSAATVFEPTLVVRASA